MQNRSQCWPDDRHTAHNGQSGSLCPSPCNVCTSPNVHVQDTHIRHKEGSTKSENVQRGKLSHLPFPMDSAAPSLRWQVIFIDIRKPCRKSPDEQLAACQRDSEADITCKTGDNTGSQRNRQKPFSVLGAKGIAHTGREVVSIGWCYLCTLPSP